jgi:hypothetical protein
MTYGGSSARRASENLPVVLGRMQGRMLGSVLGRMLPGGEET